ncbi:MAG: hypothetical protein ABW098_16975 [Candidatus Thiodiazotropha sp.]
MGHILIRVLLVMLLLASFAASASDFPEAPSTSMLHDQSGARNAVQMSCTPNYQNQTLKCQFFQMTVSYALDPEMLDASIAEELKKIETDKEYLGKEPLKEIKQLCFADAKEGKKIEAHFKKMKSGPRKDYAKRMLEISDEACKVTTIKQAKEIMTKLVKLNKQWQSVTCKVWPNTWEEIFRHKSTIDNQYWVSEAEPQGECGVINISTLKKDGEYFWKYESKRIVTNRDGSALLLSCKDIEERNVAYAWRSKEHDVNCKEIKFGF